MTTPAILRAVGLALALATMGACGGDDPRERLPPDLRPTPLPVPPGTRPMTTITVIDGWTRAPAAGVHVDVGTETFIADDRGRVEVPLGCEPARFASPAFLERRVGCLSGIIAGNAPVTLWGVADDAERDALRSFAFGGDSLVRPTHLQVDLAGDLLPRAAAVEAWQRADAEIRRATSGRFGAVVPLPVEALQDGLLVRPLSSRADCVTSNPEVAAWWRAAGFCRGRYTGPAYPAFVSLMLVESDRVHDDVVALRVLLSEIGFAPHRLPGLFNASHPDIHLSEFERRALHMAGVRVAQWPGAIVWPDWAR